MWRLIFAIPSWILFEAVVDVPLMLLGWVVIPIAAACGAYTETSPNIYHFTWKIMWLWDNYEDGIANNTYSHYDNMFLRIVSWSANRNPTNNLRLVPYLSFILDKDKVGYVGEVGGMSVKSPDDNSRDYILNRFDTNENQWYFAWHGAYTGWYWVNDFGFLGKRRVFIGWKLYPTDVGGVTEYRKNGVGFAMQFKRLGSQ